MKPVGYQLVQNAAMNANFNSSVSDLQFIWACSVQAVWAQGGGAGEIKLQVSNDLVIQNTYQDSPYSSINNWSTLDNTTSSVTMTAGSQTYFFNIVNPGYRWLRFVYTASTGTGRMYVNFFGKSY